MDKIRIFFPILKKNKTMSEFEGTPNILLAGGAGYIASHVLVCLVNAGYDITIVDNLVNSSEESINRVKEITGLQLNLTIKYFEYKSILLSIKPK